MTLVTSYWCFTIFSSMSSILNSCAVITWEDFIKNIFYDLKEARKATITKLLGKWNLYILFYVQSHSTTSRKQKPLEMTNRASNRFHDYVNNTITCIFIMHNILLYTFLTFFNSNPKLFYFI